MHDVKSSVMFTQGPKEKNNKVSHEELKMKISGPCVERQLLIFKVVFSSDQAKSASLSLKTYSLGLCGKMPSRGFILVFTPCSKESNKKMSHEALKMKIFVSYVKIPPRILKLNYMYFLSTSRKTCQFET